MRVMPTPQTWRRIPSWEWHRAGVDPGRARTVIAAATAAHRLDESLTLPRDQRLRRLRAIPGVGVWTAAEVAHVALGDPDAVSVGDYHLPNVVAWVLAGESRATDERMLELLEPYRGQRGRVIRLLEAAGIEAPRRGPRMPLRTLD